ncbi:MAG: LysR family transcriptional regulator [Pseudomonadota bacterium]
MSKYKLLDDNVLGSLDDLKYFRIVGEFRSFRKAAGVLGISPQRVKRRIDALEQRISVLLFVRTHTGVMFTPEGEKLYDGLEEFWRASAIAEQKLAETSSTLRGEVALTVTEGLGTFWLTPRLASYIETNEELTVFLHNQMHVGRPDRGECDIAISLNKPNHPDLIVKRLGYLHVMPFCAPKYRQKNGAPETVPEILHHRVVEQVSDQVPFENLAAALGGNPDEGFAAIRTNTSSAHFWAVAKGVGIGILPTYIRAITRKVEPIDMGYKERHDIWVSFNKDARKVRRTDALIDFLATCFDSKKFPWFGEAFIHPNELDSYFDSDDIAFQFEGFNEPLIVGQTINGGAGLPRGRKRLGNG